MAAIALLLGATAARAQTPPTQARTAWDSVYTAAQAARGDTAFHKICVACHATMQFRGADFLAAWDGGTAKELFELMRTQMPLDNPGGLLPDQYAEILAYLLQLNGFPPGDHALPSDAALLKQIRIQAKPERR